jgi:hypothetical protein
LYILYIDAMQRAQPITPKLESHYPRLNLKNRASRFRRSLCS